MKMVLVNNIQAYLKEKHKSIKWLSGKLKVSQSLVEEWCENKTQPTPTIIKIISDLLSIKESDVTSNEIFIQNLKNRAINYEQVDPKICSDIVAEPIYDLFFNTGENERVDEGSLRVLSLFSGCGGMDIGLEGGFICNSQSVTNPEYIEGRVNTNWVLLKKNRFKTVFACDILEEAKCAWLQYMSRFNVNPDIYHLASIVDLVKLHKKGYNIFPPNIDIVTGGFPCQDFSVAGKRAGFESGVSHDGSKINPEKPTEENRGKLYIWMKEVINIVKPKMFIAENVKGLMSLGEVHKIIQHDFAEAGDNDYIVLEPQLLHAGNYGVPETRERVIFIGIRKSALNEIALTALSKDIIDRNYNPYPEHTHSIISSQCANLPRAVSCSDVLNDLLEPEDSVDPSQQVYSCAKYLEQGQGQTEINYYGLGPTIRSEHHGNIEFRRLSFEHGGVNTEELDKGLKERRLTPRECALIQTFPPDYPFVSYKKNSKRYQISPSGAYKVIGNAVPPMLAFNIAKRIEEVWPLYFE